MRQHDRQRNFVEPGAPQHCSGGGRRQAHLRQVRADDFRYLSAIARTGTRRSAALDLGVDHTTVSRRVHPLEKTLDVRLIERGAVGWELTDIGRTVADRARAIEVTLQEAVEAAVGDPGSTLRGRVRVTAPDGFGTLIVAPALARLRMRHRNLSVELLTATRQMNLQQSGFDVAIAVGATVNSRLVSETISTYSHVHQYLCARRGHPRRRRDRTSAGFHGQPAS